MKHQAADFKRILAGVALILAPLLYFPADYALYISKDVFLNFQVGQVLLAVWVPAVLGMYHLFRGRADLWGVAAGGMCLIGLLAAMGIFTFSVVRDVIERAATNPEQISPEIIEGFRSVAPLVFMPGLLFPLGMLLFGIGMLRYRFVPVWVGILWCLGAVLFPVGRIPDTALTVFSSDVLLLIALGWLGVRYLTQRAYWHPEVLNQSAASEPLVLGTAAFKARSSS
jgi:hypothetical protein